MAGQENFAAVIKDYLDQRAKTDKLFAKSYNKKGKSLDECCNYIIGEVQKKAKTMTDGHTFMSLTPKPASKNKYFNSVAIYC